MTKIVVEKEAYTSRKYRGKAIFKRNPKVKRYRNKQVKHIKTHFITEKLSEGMCSWDKYKGLNTG